MARKSKPKIADTVLADLETLKDTTAALEEVLADEDFDYSEVEEYCSQIEELALAIKTGVETK